MLNIAEIKRVIDEQDYVQGSSILISQHTPKTLTQLGIPDYPMVIAHRHFAKIISSYDRNQHNHGVSEYVASHFDDMYYLPVFVSDDTIKDCDVAVALRSTDSDGFPLISFIHVNGKSLIDGQEDKGLQRVNYIETIFGCKFGKYRTIYKHAVENNSLLYIDKIEFNRIIHNTSLKSYMSDFKLKPKNKDNYYKIKNSVNAVNATTYEDNFNAKYQHICDDSHRIAVARSSVGAGNRVQPQTVALN